VCGCGQHVVGSFVAVIVHCALPFLTKRMPAAVSHVATNSI